MNKTARNSIIYMVGTIIIAIVSFFNTIILTRVLSTQVYAQYGLLSSFITASVTVISLGMDTAYTRFFYESGYSPLRYLVKCCQIPVIVLVLYMLILLEPNHLLLKYVFETDVSLLFIVLLSGYLLFSLFGKFSQLTARMGEFAVNYVLSNFIQKAGFVIVIFALYWTVSEISFNLVVFSFLLAAAFSVFINLYTLKRVRGVQNSKHEKVTTTEMLKYGMPIMINNVMMLIIPLVERLVIRDLAGWEVLSLYTAASVFYTVIALMKNTIDNIWNPIVFQHYENEKVFKPLLHDFGLLITWITTVGLGLCILLRRYLVLILDASYFDVYLIAPAIMYTACYEIYTLIYSVGINTSKKTSHMILAPIFRFIISIGLCFLLVPSLGLVGAGIASLVSVVLSKTYRIIVGLHYYGTNQREWKITILWVSCILASVFVMFSTSLYSDVIICIALCLISFIVINVEGVSLIKVMCNIFLPKKFRKS